MLKIFVKNCIEIKFCFAITSSFIDEKDQDLHIKNHNHGTNMISKIFMFSIISELSIHSSIYYSRYPDIHDIQENL